MHLFLRHLRPVLNRSVLFWTLIWFQTPMSNFRHFFPILDSVVQYLTVLLAFGHCCPIFDSITCFWTLLSNIWQYYLLLDTVVQYLTVLLAFGHYCPNFGHYYPVSDSIFWFRAVLSGFWKLLPCRFVRFNAIFEREKLISFFLPVTSSSLSETKRVLLTRKSCT